MNFNGKRRSSTNGRQGAAALMIGGLVAGVVATAGAVTLNAPEQEDAQNLRAALLHDRPAEESTQEGPSVDPADEAAALMSLRSASIDQLREQVAADRSEARTAPEDAATPSTLLSASGFTGRAVEVAPPAPEPAAEEPVAAPVTPESAPAAQAAPQTSAAPVTQSTQSTQATTAQRSETRSEPAPEPASEPRRAEPTPEPAPEPAPSPPPATGGVLGIAASYVGYPYVLHGTPPNAFDCSAFTWWVYNQAGIDIPRSVAGQRAAVTPVSNPQPGDLVIYNDWHHVGIYAGNGMTYEALNPSTGVRFGPILSSNVWYGRIG